MRRVLAALAIIIASVVLGWAILAALIYYVVVLPLVHVASLIGA